MVSLFSLWLPILLSAVFVFIVSSIIHMLLKYHCTDWNKIPDEDGVMEALRKYNIPPGDYFFPHCKDLKESSSPEAIEKANKGPVGVVTIMENGMPKMGGPLFMWFLYSILVSIFAAYVAGVTLAPGTHYLTVFRVIGAVAFSGYSLALLQNSIWYKRNCVATLKSVFDGLIYALVTAGVFGWLWPGL